jgi:hypothetical protein
LTYGSSNNDTNFTSTNQGGGVNITLNFNFPFQNSMYSSVQINVNGFVTLNNSITIAAYANYFCTNGTGSAVYYRHVSSGSALTTLTSAVVSAYTNYTFFTATQALVITWYLVQSTTTPSQLNTFQLVLVTDYVDSFLLFSYARLDSASQIACSTYNPANTSYLTLTTNANCTQNGTWVENVNDGGRLFLNS